MKKSLSDTCSPAQQNQFPQYETVLYVKLYAIIFFACIPYLSEWIIIIMNIICFSVYLNNCSLKIKVVLQDFRESITVRWTAHRAQSPIREYIFFAHFCTVVFIMKLRVRLRFGLLLFKALRHRVWQADSLVASLTRRPGTSVSA